MYMNFLAFAQEQRMNRGNRFGETGDGGPRKMNMPGKYDGLACIILQADIWTESTIEGAAIC